MSGCSPKLDCHKFSTTGDELPGGLDLGREVRESESVPREESLVIRSQEDPISSPMRSLQLLYSSQSSEEGIKEAKMIPQISPFKETGAVQFENTLSEEDCKFLTLFMSHYY